MRKQRGFTLAEIAVAVLIIGVISMIMAPLFGQIATASANEWREKQKLNNRSLSQALMQYAAVQSVTGSLPSPYSNAGSSTYSTVANPTNAGLMQTIQQSQVGATEINDDGRSAANVRVYQLVTGLTQNVPLYAQSGPIATVTYQYGAIYQTYCNRADAACNLNPLPSSSVAMTSTNYATWAPAGTDFGESFVSSLPQQKQMLWTTAQRMDRVRDSMLSYFRGRQTAAASDDSTNFYPNSTTSPATAVGSASTNQGCWYSWIDLSTSDVLSILGMSSAEHGATAWGGHVEYCRDYDPSGTGAVDASPHYGAVRILTNVSGGGAPDGSVAANNIILSF